jgi:DNA-binding transcriptional LysR family regulator
MKIYDHLDKLKILVAVVEQKKINAAAQVLGLSQPAVTRAIQTLEHAAGFPLLVRSREGVALTPAGATVYENSARILKEVRDFMARAEQPADSLAGRLTIGTYETLAEYLWPEFIIHFQKTYPQLELSLRTGSQESHNQGLNIGTMDMLVDAEPRLFGENRSWPLYTDAFAFYARSSASHELTPESAKAMALVYVPKIFDKNDVSLEEHLKRQGYAFKKEYIFDSFSTVKRLALRGLGVAILPIRLATEDVSANRLRRLSAKGFAKDGFATHTVCATLSAKRVGDARLKLMIRELKKFLK